jgi:hypothetical protein
MNLKAFHLSLIAAIALGQPAHADLKITTRTTVMGRSMENTVYIKGARERREMNFGGRNMATITQCDQKRMITVSENRCMVVPMGGSAETSCPAMPTLGTMGAAMGRQMGGGEAAAPPRAGGVITITRNSTDTGERQEMFGYKARHIKTSMTSESSPDACNKANAKIETDGWYADLSVDFSCGEDSSARIFACGGMGGPRGGGAACRDRVVMKGNGGAALGYPLKQTTTITSPEGTFTTTTEVTALTNATLDAALFDSPAGCTVMNMGGPLTTAPATPAPETAPPPTTATSQAAPSHEAAPAAAAPAPAPKAAGTVRIGVVKLKDATGQSLPTDNLRMNLMSEIVKRQMEAVPLDASSDASQDTIINEARAKQCDYVLYTTPTQVKEPNSGGLPAASVPKGTALDPTKYEALTAMTLYKVSKPLPEIKDFNLAANGDKFDVDAVTATFEKESDKVAQQVQEDAHPKAAAKKPIVHRKPK